MRIRTLMLGLVSVMMLAYLMNACSSSGSAVEKRWKSATAPADGFRKPVIIVLTGNRIQRAKLEKDIIARLADKGATAFAGTDLIPSSVFDPEQKQKLENEAVKKAVVKILAEQGVDGALLVRSLGINDDERYLAGTTSYAPGAYGNQMYGYWFSSYASSGTQAAWVSANVASVLSNFYTVPGEAMVLTLRIKIQAGASFEKMSQAYAATLVEALLEEGIVAK